MVEFEIINGDLITFLEKVACNGVVLITATEKLTKNFFNYFYITAEIGEEPQLVVKAVDSEEKRMYIRHYLKGVDIKIPGDYAVTDVGLLLDILKSIPTKRRVVFKVHKEEAVLTIETVDEGTYYGYHIRQTVPSEELENALKNSKFGVSEFDKIHTFENGIPKITYDGAVAYHSCIVALEKGDLQKVVKDSIKLTRDQDLKLSLVQSKPGTWVFKVRSGNKSDNIISNTTLQPKIFEPIPFDEKKITNIHPIVNHLFDKVSLFFRLAGDGALKFWVLSKRDNIELNFLSSSL